MVGHNHATRELVREVLERPELRLVPHVGYVSLFPFMGRIIPPVSHRKSKSRCQCLTNYLVHGFLYFVAL